MAASGENYTDPLIIERRDVFKISTAYKSDKIGIGLLQSFIGSPIAPLDLTLNEIDTLVQRH